MNLNRIGSYMCMLLRHRPEAGGITLDEHGWADIDALIGAVCAHKYADFSRELLDEIVRTDNKQRYSVSEDGTKIRCNQGHSVPVDVELDRAVPPEFLWHGTGEKYVASIDEHGLIAKSRLYVHLSSDINTAQTVGARHGRPVIYRVRSGAMAQDGYAFYLSRNGVWLAAAVPVEYLEKMPQE